MNFKLSIGSTSSLVNLYGYGDEPIMSHIPPVSGNYNLVKLCVREEDGYTSFNSRGNPFRLNDADMSYLIAIQPSDSDLYLNAETYQKVNWLTGDKGRPYFKKNGNWMRDCMVYGHAPVRVGKQHIFDAEFPGGSEKDAKFREIDGFKRSMMGTLGELVEWTYMWDRDHNGTLIPIKTRVRNLLIPLIEKGYLQVCTESFLNGSISATSKGVKLDRVHDPKEFFVSTGKVFIWEGCIIKQ